MRRIIASVRDHALMGMISDIVEGCRDDNADIRVVKSPDMIAEILCSSSDALVLISQEMAREVVERVSRGSVGTNFAVVATERCFDAMREAFRAGALDCFILPDDSEALAQFLLGSSVYFERDIKKAAHRRIATVNTAMRVIYDEFLNPATIDELESVYGDYFRSQYEVFCVADGDFAQQLRHESLLSFHDYLGHIVMVMPAGRLDETEKKMEDHPGGLSLSHVGLAGLHSAYREALSARKRAFLLGRGMVRFSVDNEPSPVDFADRELEQALQHLAAGSCDELMKILQEIYQRAADDKMNHDSLEWFAKTFAAKARVYCTHETELEEFASFANPWQYESAREYLEHFGEFINRSMYASDGESEVSHNKQKIQRAIEYIRENYSGVLNMAIVSNYVSMNYSLFSLEFKKYTKMNFVRYLQNFRIKESMRLLLTTDYKISEISRMTGFRDDKHFMKVFKSICGVSPSAYRRNNTPAVSATED